jgi:CRP-like cAMP-binding protein
MMPREARSKILAIATPNSFPGGTEIMREGDRVGWFGIVASGRIALQLGVSGRGQVTLETVEVGHAGR